MLNRYHHHFEPTYRKKGVGFNFPFIWKLYFRNREREREKKRKLKWQMKTNKPKMCVWFDLPLYQKNGPTPNGPISQPDWVKMIVFFSLGDWLASIFYPKMATKKWNDCFIRFFHIEFDVPWCGTTTNKWFKYRIVDHGPVDFQCFSVYYLLQLQLSLVFFPHSLSFCFSFSVLAIHNC